MRELGWGFARWKLQWQFHLIVSPLSLHPCPRAILPSPCAVLTQPGMGTGWQKTDWESRPAEKWTFFSGLMFHNPLYTQPRQHSTQCMPLGMRGMGKKQGHPESVPVITDFAAWCHKLQTCLSKVGINLITSQSRNEQQQPFNWHQRSAPLPKSWDTRSFVSRLHSTFPLLLQIRWIL